MKSLLAVNSRVMSRLGLVSVLQVGFVVLLFASLGRHVEEREINYYDVASHSSQSFSPIQSGITSLLGVPVFDLSSGLGQRVPNVQGVGFSGWVLWRALFNAEMIHMVSVVISGLLQTVAAFQLLRKGLQSNPLQLLLVFACLHWNSLFSLRETDYATVMSSFHASTCLVLFLFRCEIASSSQEHHGRIDLLPIAFAISISTAHYGFVIPTILFTLVYAACRPRQLLRGLRDLGCLGWLALAPALLSIGTFLLELATFSRYTNSSPTVTSFPPLKPSNFKHILKQMLSDDFLILRSVGDSFVNLDDIVTTGSAAIGTGFVIAVVVVRLILSRSLQLSEELRTMFVATMGLWCLATLFSGTVWLLADREPIESLISTYESLWHVPALIAVIGGIAVLDRFTSVRSTMKLRGQRRRVNAVLVFLVIVFSVVVFPAYFTGSRDGGPLLPAEDSFDLDDLLARINHNGQQSMSPHRLLTLEEELYIFKDEEPATTEILRDYGLFSVSRSSKLRPTGHASTTVVALSPYRPNGECYEIGLKLLQVEIVMSSRERNRACWEIWEAGGLNPEVLGSPMLSSTGKRAVIVTRFRNVQEVWSNESGNPNSPVCDLLGDCLKSLGVVSRDGSRDFGLRLSLNKPGLSFTMPQTSNGSNLLLPLRWDPALSLRDQSTGTELAISEKHGLIAIPTSVVERTRGSEIEVSISPDHYMRWIGLMPWAWWLAVFMWFALQWRARRGFTETLNTTQRCDATIKVPRVDSDTLN